MSDKDKDYGVPGCPCCGGRGWIVPPEHYAPQRTGNPHAERPIMHTVPCPQCNGWPEVMEVLGGPTAMPKRRGS